MEATKHPYALAREEGETLWFLGVPTRVIATAEQTGGAFGLIEHVIPAGGESPWHVHHAEADAFYVVEGQMTFLCGEQKRLMSLAAKYDSEILGPLPDS